MASNINDNDTMMQFFEWYLPSNASLWNKLKDESNKLSNLGIDYIWMPPAYKAAGGINDVGYGVYDLYDLGEFNQKETIATKYGLKNEYLDTIKALQQNGIKAIADIVLNHKLGADETEEVYAVQDESSNRNISISEAKKIKAWTKYTFPGRNGIYSDFKWDWTHFHGVDWDESTNTASIYKFYGKKWDQDVDKENGNFDYLMGADIDLNNKDVVEELKNWSKWYYDTTKVDGFRLDAVKHIRADFFPEWLENIRRYSGKDLFAVGEYWSTNMEVIQEYINKTNQTMKLFDVALHYNFFRAAYSNGEFNLNEIFEGTLVKQNPNMAVTFVDNHDTQIGQALESWIPDWFKPLAYSLILLRKEGIPCVFYGDYYGIEHDNITPKNDLLDKLLLLRKNYAYGEQIDYFYDNDKIGFLRKGDTTHEDSGLVVVMSDKLGGEIIIDMGEKFKNTEFFDYLGNVEETIKTDENGKGAFICKNGSVSVWVKNK
ncbi:MAG: alpha-amylase [Candidatus Scatovivens sp.]